MKKDEKLIEVYKATNEMEAQVIRGLLESYGIPCILKSNAAPSVMVFTTDGMSEVKIMVAASAAVRATELINKNDEHPHPGPLPSEGEDIKDR